MIGQRKNKELFNRWLQTTCPRFVCFVGARGSGKKTLAKYLADSLSLNYIATGIGVDDVREVIISATKYGGFYVFEDADNMSINAKNALLKITEEPPKNSYFVVTVQDEASLLDTIRSRAQIVRMEPYTKQDIIDYGCNYPNTELLSNAIDIASTPLELDIIMEYGQDFIDYVSLVVRNIREVEPANAFKSAKKLALKNEEDKYDLGIFFQCVIQECIRNYVLSPTVYANMMMVTSKCLTQCSRLGVNKQQLYDTWVFEVREI